MLLISCLIALSVVIHGAKIGIFRTRYTFFCIKNVIRNMQTFALIYVNFRGEK